MLCQGRILTYRVQPEHKFSGIFVERERTLLGYPCASQLIRTGAMNLGRGLMLWLLGVPIPIILILALFWHH